MGPCRAVSPLLRGMCCAQDQPGTCCGKVLRLPDPPDQVPGCATVEGPLYKSEKGPKKTGTNVSMRSGASRLIEDQVAGTEPCGCVSKEAHSPRGRWTRAAGSLEALDHYLSAVGVSQEDLTRRLSCEGASRRAEMTPPRVPRTSHTPRTLSELFEHSVRQEVGEVQVPPPPFFGPDHLYSVCFDRIRDRLVAVAVKALFVEMHLCRSLGYLEGGTPTDRYRDFLRLASHPDFLEYLWAKYPALHRLVSTIRQNSVMAGWELAERLSADWPDLREQFALSAFLARTPAEPVGDPHHGGRRTLILRDAQGKSFLYKPRGADTNRAIERVLCVLAPQLPLDLKVPRRLEREVYYWEEYAERHPCQSEAELRSYFRRLGQWLAILYAVAADDIHFENVVADGQYPIIVDLECIAAPKLATRGSEYRVAPLLTDNVLALGIVPVRFGGRPGRAGIDFSVLGADSRAQQTPVPVEVIRDDGLDTARVEKAIVSIPASGAGPTLLGQAARHLDYIGDFVDSFSLTAEVCGRLGRKIERALFEEEILPRIVVRGTQIYGETRQRMIHPQLLLDALRVDERLLELIKMLPGVHGRDLVPAEMDSLWEGDIPRFTVNADSTVLAIGPGVSSAEAELPLTSGRSRVRQHLEWLASEGGRRVQVGMIKYAVTASELEYDITRVDESVPVEEVGIADGHPSSHPLARDVEAAVQRLASDLLGAYWHDGTHSICPTLQYSDRGQWRVQSAAHDLYGGLPGIGLFFLTAGAYFGADELVRVG